MSKAPEQKPSKSQLKREMLALQKLGEALIELPEHELHEIPLPDKLREAVEFARSLSKRGALYRQKQYIGKLMREIDKELVEQAVVSAQGRRMAAARHFHELESWRDKIIAEGESGIDAFMRSHPTADRQRLRTLLRQIRSPRVKDASKRAERALFRCLRELPEA